MLDLSWIAALAKISKDRRTKTVPVNVDRRASQGVRGASRTLNSSIDRFSEALSKRVSEPQK